MNHSDPTSRTVPGLWTASLVLTGLAAVAITQPLFDILGSNAEFFVAGRYDRGQIVALALIVAWVPAAIAVAAVALAGLAGPRAWVVVYSVAAAILAALFGLVVLRNIGVDHLAISVPLAVALGVAIVAADRRVPAVRMFLRYLAAANLVFLASFLFFSRASELLSSPVAATGLGEVRIPQLRGPVVVIILDELPLTTILRADGSLNDERFPNLARVADTGTWFRNASSRAAKTHIAVPEMLTGRTVDDGQLPTYREHPRNLLTLFGSQYPVHRYEVVTDLCPAAICEPNRSGSLLTAVEDTATVYGHLALPESVRKGLPRIDHAWGSFGEELDAAIPEQEFTDEAAYSRWSRIGSEKSASGQSRVLVEQGAAVTRDTAVHLIHVALPHYPWTINQNGRVTTDLPYPRESGDGYDSDGLFGYQMQTMQAGAADRALGELIDHLERRGIWDDALLAVMADHGSSVTPPDFGRKITDANREEVLRVPMLIKAPGQTEGAVRDDVAMTVDLVPSIVDLLDIRTDWEFDGHSLFDRSSPTLDPQVSRDVDAAIRVAEAQAARTTGDDWIGLVATGDHHGLVGRPVAAFEEGRPSPLRWTLVRQPELADLSLEGPVPFVLGGSVTHPSSQPPQLVVALNGSIAGTVHEYKRMGDGSWRFDAMLADFFVEGPNEVDAFEVEQTTNGPVLHQLG
jgi:hypothetical protein